MTPRPGDEHVIRAAGGVLWRSVSGQVEVALAHRPKYDDWTFPKGKLKHNEHPLAGAARKVAEKTAQQTVADRRLPSRTYATRLGPKTVDYWSMRAEAGTFASTAEVDELVWLSPAAARRRLSYRQDAGLLDSLDAVDVDAAVLLVRHAAAGDPARSLADDTLRPLDAAGLAQAEALRHVLPIFGVSRVLTVPNVRCIDTVAPLAADLGVAVDPEDTFGEETYAEHPQPALRRLRNLAADSATPAVCSQGTVIPDIIATLAAEDRVTLTGLKAKKGSVWALFFSHDRLVGADYYPTMR